MRAPPFFFSSRRRHTRWTGDWSSDVCSSDLGYQRVSGRLRQLAEGHPASAEALYYCGVSIFQSAEGMGKPAALAAAEEYLKRAVSSKPDYAPAHLERSEERRVGKGCRSRWAT